MRYGKNVNNGAVIKNFTWCGNNLIYEGDGNASDYLGKCYNYGYGLISSYDNNASAPTIYEKDGHGSVVMTLNSSYSNMSMPSYDAFGISSSALSSATDPMRYCGEYQDYESGLIYLRARYYNPQLGRFINEDPHWNPDNMVYGDSSQNTDVKSVPNYSAIIQSSNLYPYCANNPIRFVDPSGKSWVVVAITGGVIIAAIQTIYESESVKEAHYNRNENNVDLPKNKTEAIKNGWASEIATYHQFTATENGENIKYISPDGHREVIFDYTEKNIVTTPEDMGTYNYFDPKSNPLGHIIADVIPWYIYGNSPNDTTTFKDRVMIVFEK